MDMHYTWEITDGLSNYWPGYHKGEKKGRYKMKREVERMMKQKNLTPEDAANQQVWQKWLMTSEQCNTEKLL